MGKGKEKQLAIHTGYFSVVGNAVLAIVKLLAGIFGNSYALIADGIESTADVFSSLFVLFGIKYTQRPADRNHPFGHGRLEPLISLLVGLFLVASAVFIIVESIYKIQTPHPLPKPFTLYILVPIILWKIMAYRVVLKRAKQTHHSSLEADAQHHLSDSFTSIFAFIGISIALYLGEGYAYADDYAALAASLFILYNSYRIFRPALAEIMDEHVYDDMVAEVRRISAQVDGVEDTEKCFIRKSGLEYHLDLHARVKANLTVKKGHEISHRLKDKLMKEIPSLKYVLIHIEPEDENWD